MRLRIIGVGLLVTGVLAAVVATGLFSQSSADDQAVAVTPPPVVGCAARAEPSVKRFGRRRDVIRGPFALVTLARDLPLLSRASYRPSNGRLPVVKLPVGLRAGHTATLSVAPNQRPYAALTYREETRDARGVQDGDRAVAFKPCRADTPAFGAAVPRRLGALSGGIVGPITGWAGALILTGPRCIRLEVRVDGQRQPDIRLPLGRRCA